MVSAVILSYIAGIAAFVIGASLHKFDWKKVLKASLITVFVLMLSFAAVMVVLSKISTTTTNCPAGAGCGAGMGIFIVLLALLFLFLMVAPDLIILVCAGYVAAKKYKFDLVSVCVMGLMSGVIFGILSEFVSVLLHLYAGLINVFAPLPSAALCFIGWLIAAPAKPQEKLIAKKSKQS